MSAHPDQTASLASIHVRNIFSAHIYMYAHFHSYMIIGTFFLKGVFNLLNFTIMAEEVLALRS